MDDGELTLGLDLPEPEDDGADGWTPPPPAFQGGKLRFLEAGGIYGIWVYVSMFGARASHDYESAREAQKVYNFKKYGRNAETVKAAIEWLADELGCAAVVACPGHEPGETVLQRLFGTTLARTRPVQSRKYGHNAEIDFELERQSLEMPDDFFERVKGRKVLVVDDVATTGKTLRFYRLLFESVGVKAQLAAIGIMKSMRPERTGPEWTMPEKESPKSGAERVADFVARRNEIGPLPPVADPARRERASASLVEFGTLYGMATADWPGMLLHEPSERLREYAEALQSGIDQAGFLHIRLPRAAGKTTWAKLALAWGLSTGRIRFGVVIAANATLADATLSDVWTFFETSPAFGADFPDVAIPVRRLEGTPQKAASQTLNGERTMIKRTAGRIVLATVPESPASGARLVAKGAGAAVRGMVAGGDRPDFILLDDIQTRETATSPTSTNKLAEWIHGDVLGLGGAKQLSVVMTSTPIVADDLSERFADKSREPAWRTISYPMVISWPANGELWLRYCDLLRNDLAAVGGEAGRTAAEFYGAHAAAMEAGAKLFDPLNFDPRIERSATQHAYNLLVRGGEAAFRAEYMLEPPKGGSVIELTAAQVAERVNGAERYRMPPGTQTALAFIDVMATGLHYVVAAFGPRQTGAVIDYGRHPQRGRLIPPGVSERDQERLLATGLAALLDKLLGLPLADAGGRPAQLAAVWLDHRWMRRTVTQVATLYRLRRGANIWTCAGFDSAGYKDGAGRNVVARGFNVDFREIDGVRFAAQNSDFWKETAQRSFLAVPLSPGSVSLYGKAPGEHGEFGLQITAERLVDKAAGAKGEIYRWTLRPGGENHWLDCLGGCLAAASWYRLWDGSDVPPSAVLRIPGAPSTAAPPPARPGRRVVRRSAAQRRL